MKQIHKLVLLLILSSFGLLFPRQISAKSQISADLYEVLQRKSNGSDSENRVIVAFKTQTDPSKSLQKLPLQFFEAEEYRAVVGNLIVNEMKSENWELEKSLLAIVNESQIVRRLPIGNAFILEGLSLQQANKISQLDRTVLLALSKFTSKGGENVKSKCISLQKEEEEEPFEEPVEDIQEWKEPVCDPLLKAVCEPTIPWNIQNMKFPQVWSRGYKGKGIIYGVIDTGVSYKHPVLASNYFGRKANGSFDHNYAWYDAVRSEPKAFAPDCKKDRELDLIEQRLSRQGPIRNLYKSQDDGYEADIPSESFSDDFESKANEKNLVVTDKCGYATNEPCDTIGHGTHVASTAVGGAGMGTAPEAQWMACRSIASDMGREEDSLACLNFFLAPQDLNGENARPDLRPHVIGNSYGWESWAEVIGAGIDLAVKRLEAAGTVMVFAAGNSGPACGTIHSAFSFTVGATSEDGSLAPFSSRGPWTISPRWRNIPRNPHQPIMIKPEISAPGKSIIGALGSGHVAKMSGTSMATPHVAGSIALLRKQPTKFISLNLTLFF